MKLCKNSICSYSALCHSTFYTSFHKNIPQQNLCILYFIKFRTIYQPMPAIDSIQPKVYQLDLLTKQDASVPMLSERCFQFLPLNEAIDSIAVSVIIPCDHLHQKIGHSRGLQTLENKNCFMRVTPMHPPSLWSTQVFHPSRVDKSSICVDQLGLRKVSHCHRCCASQMTEFDGQPSRRRRPSKYHSATCSSRELTLNCSCLFHDWQKCSVKSFLVFYYFL